MIRDLAHKAGLPERQVFFIDSAQPNAFATGRKLHNAAGAATTGLLQTLSETELREVISHELAPVKHRDALIMTVAATLAGAIAVRGNFARVFAVNRRDSEDSASLLRFIGVVVAMVIAPFAAILVQLTISRTREYAADKRGAEICGNPLWLAAALQKIDQRAKVFDNEYAEKNPTSAHLFIKNPFNGPAINKLFSTRPNARNRIAALHQQARRINLSLWQNPLLLYRFATSGQVGWISNKAKHENCSV